VGALIVLLWLLVLLFQELVGWLSSRSYHRTHFRPIILLNLRVGSEACVSYHLPGDGPHDIVGPHIVPGVQCLLPALILTLLTEEVLWEI